MSNLPKLRRFRAARLPHDSPFILELIREFYAKQGHLYGIPFDTTSAAVTIAETAARGVCLVGKSSCAGVIISPYQWNRNARLAHVLFWYFRAPREMGIFEAALVAAKMAGATHVFAASHPPGHVIDRLYARLGLHKTELLSMKQL